MRMGHPSARTPNAQVSPANFCAIPISKLYFLDTNDIDTVGTRGQAARASDLIPL
jgi:hypothetical protein